MNYKLIILLIAMISIEKVTKAMEPTVAQIEAYEPPVELINYSPEVVTLYRLIGNGTGYINEVETNQICDRSLAIINPYFFRVSRYGFIRINTIKGLFNLSIDSSKNTLTLKKNYNNELEEVRIKKFSNVLCILKAIITVDNQGMPDLSIITKKPQDGRPDVPLEVYSAVVGNASYATPKQILGIKCKDTDADAKRCYKDKILEWHPDRNKSSEATQAFQLINWAASSLKLK